MEKTMKTYTVEIDNGQGGDTTITAKSVTAALAKGIDWARTGDWPEEGCTINVRATNDDDESDTAEEDVHIPSTDEKLQERLDDEGEVLAEDESEFARNQVLRIGEDYFYRECNGGWGGAWDHRQNPNVFECVLLSRSEARAKMLEMDCDVSEVARKTA
jgi:hypothetical protein